MIERPRRAAVSRSSRGAPEPEPLDRARHADERHLHAVRQREIHPLVGCEAERPVERGSVRIHTTVEERPVEEKVNLREERVNVERRPVDRRSSDPFRW